MRNPAWQRDELILALDVYFRESYNKLGPTHPTIKELSHILNRLPIFSAELRNQNDLLILRKIILKSMNHLARIQRNRRLVLMILLVFLGFAAGFVWGKQYGYGQGKLDTVKAIEKRFNAPEPTAPQI